MAQFIAASSPAGEKHLPTALLIKTIAARAKTIEMLLLMETMQPQGCLMHAPPGVHLFSVYNTHHNARSGLSWRLLLINFSSSKKRAPGQMVHSCALGERHNRDVFPAEY
jgi:hypothetical protein